jgi:pimeloyl-ACP methyl ester carboxylesterase
MPSESYLLLRWSHPSVTIVAVVLVFVHGVPETADLWKKVRPLMEDESVALSMPGFGCARPDGFGATKDEYVAWLLDELDKIEGPIDLIGHDWGAGLTYRVATAHGDRIRSWVADVANVMHPEYEWHDFAKIWQSPGDGETFFRDQLATPPDGQAQVFEALGVEHDDALEMARWADATMGTCILDLYRSATPNPYADWSDAWGITAAPGLVISPTDDPFGDDVLSRQVADTLGARHEHLPGAGHWWALQAPEDAAALLREFLASTN